VLGGDVTIEPVLVPADCKRRVRRGLPRPEAYLGTGIQASMSACGLLEPDEIAAGVARLAD
jgi:hypothetical protein